MRMNEQEESEFLLEDEWKVSNMFCKIWLFETKLKFMLKYNFIHQKERGNGHFI